MTSKASARTTYMEVMGVSRFLVRVSRFAAVVRRVIGVPDYDRYVAHVRARHPGLEPVGAAEFYRLRLEERYNKPGARCC